MKFERHTGPRPWKVARSSTETAFVVSEDGHAILAIPSANIVLVPYFQLMLPEVEYIGALVKTCLAEKGKSPETLHVFEHEGLIGFCAQ